MPSDRISHDLKDLRRLMEQEQASKEAPNPPVVSVVAVSTLELKTELNSLSAPVPNHELVVESKPTGPVNEGSTKGHPIDHERYERRKASLLRRFKTLRALRQQLSAARRQLIADRQAFAEEFAQLERVESRQADISQREAAVAEREAAVTNREEAASERENALAAREQLQEQVAELAAQVRRQSKLVTSTKAARTQTIGTLHEWMADFAATDSEVKRLKHALKLSKKAQSAAESELNKLQGQLKRKASEAAKLLAKAVDLNVSSEPLLHWLGEQGEPQAFAFDEDCRLGWSGTGPYDAGAFDRLLGDTVGVDQYQLPDASITHVVVGRNGWSQEDLRQTIELRADQTLRVYSQEMLLVALMTGRDPLDEADTDVLAAFRKGHPALEFLSTLDFPWPYMAEVDTSVVVPPNSAWEAVPQSPLNLLGYSVGSTSPLDVDERQEILDLAYRIEHLPPVHSDAYMENWGGPLSHQRLYRIARHLSGLINTLGRRGTHQQARSDWEDDLAWLYEEIYVPRRYRFQWP